MLILSVFLTVGLSLLISFKAKKSVGFWVYPISVFLFMPLIAYVLEGLRLVLGPMSFSQIAGDFVFSTGQILSAPLTFNTQENFSPALALLGGTAIMSLCVGIVSAIGSIIRSHQKETAQAKA